MLSAPSPPLALTLRPYQEECVQCVLSAYQQRPQGGRALIVVPTGGGKTLMFTEVARRLGLTTLVIAHRQELLQQAANKFRLADPTAVVGQVGAGRHKWGAPITVASIQTISRPEHLKNLSQFWYQLVVIDESHHAASDGYKLVLAALSNAFVLAVTATPDRLDKQRIESIFGEPVFPTSILEMVEQGYLCDLRAIAVRTATSLDSVHTPSGAYVLEVGEHRHRIALVPSALREGYYAVWAKLAPSFNLQQWLKESPLEWAQTHAEMKARLLQTDEKKRVLVDSHAPWRSHPASLKQISMLRYYGLDFQPEITSGEASDLIGQEKARREQAKAKERVARQALRSRQKTSRGALPI